MRIQFLAEGNPRTRDSWSGISKSVYSGLKALGNEMHPSDVDPKGLDRYWAALCSFSPNRERWRARFRLAGPGFRIRSRNAIRAVSEANVSPDILFQAGAAFHSGDAGIPYVVYCDSNFWVAENNIGTEQSYANHMTASEIQKAKGRELRVYEGASAIFTISDRLRRSFLEDVGVSPEKVVTVHAGPNFDGPLPDVTARKVHEAMPPKILFVGRRFERKGGPVLLAAFEKVKRAIPDARLSIVGPDSPSEEVPGVDWLGFLNKGNPQEAALLDKEYREATVFCLPTLWEPFGIVFIEAMFYGLPCVASNLWAIPEMVREGETGILVPPGNSDSLALALIQLLSNSESAKAMGMAARKRAEESFTWERCVSVMQSVMEDIPKT